MALSLEFEDKYRLWSALVQGAADRLFVATPEPPAIGAQVPVRVSVPGQDLTTLVRGQVVGRRRPGARFPGGVYLHFSHEELDACRDYLGLAQPHGPYARGRRWPRVYRTLPLRFKEPRVDAPCASQNLSEAGMLVTCPVALFAGQRVEVALTLDDGNELPLSGEVVWVKPAEQLAGLRFVDLPANSSQALASALKRMLQATPRKTTHVVVMAEVDAATITAVQEALAPLRAEAFAVQSGQEVLSLTHWLRPSLVLLDALMPGLDAVDICKRMHADAELAEIPIIFHATLSPDRLHVLADEAGATDYLAKPATREELTQLLGEYLRGA